MAPDKDWLDRVNAAIDANKLDDGMVVELLLAFCGTLPPAGKEGLVRYMERECMAVGPSDLWKNNELQFARLLCELVAACDNLEAERVAASMDLTTEQLSELYDRADLVWETAKEKV